MTPRVHEAELMEQADADAASLDRALGDLERINRWLGGYRALRLHLEPLRASDRAVRVLDVGSGDGATLEELARWAPPSWSFVGVDLHATVLRLARSRAPADAATFVRGDGLRLPFRDDSFDAALCTLTLHHLQDEQAVVLTREMARVSTDLVVVNDLERSGLHLLGARILAATLWRRSPFTRNDAPLSVRRSFTRGELERIGQAAGLDDVRVRRRWLFRLVLDGRPAADE